MYPSSSLCRAQEAYQRRRAAGTPLENVRVIANKAAAAWREEALGAERREARHERTRAVAEARSTQKREAREQAEAGRAEIGTSKVPEKMGSARGRAEGVQPAHRPAIAPPQALDASP